MPLQLIYVMNISFPFHTNWPHFDSAQKHCIMLIPEYIPTHLNVEVDYLSWERLILGWHLPDIAQLAFQLWCQPEVICWHLNIPNQCQHNYILENSLPLGALGLNAFSHPWTHQVSYMFPPSALVPLVLSKFLAEHITGQVRFIILVASCLMEASWLPTALNI